MTATARAENAQTGLAAPEASPAITSPNQDSAAPPEPEQPARKPERFRIGVLGGVGFPRPFAIEGLFKIARVFALGAEYSVLPTMTISGAQVSFYAVAADMRVFPFAGPFFIGLRAGRQHLSGKASMMIDPFGELTARASLDTTFLNPRLGFLWTWKRGITLGIDAGVQFPVSSKVSSNLPAGNAQADQVISTANSLGRTVLPTVDLVRLGILL
jgi:hypothetical protein